MSKIVVPAILLLLAVPSATAQTPSRQSSVLTSLADMGTVYWRFDCARGEPQRWSLGVRIFYTATTHVTLRSGRWTVKRTLQPREKVWFPLTTARVQRLALVQKTEPGTLRGSVEVDFGHGQVNHCESYLPPRFTVELYPR